MDKLIRDHHWLCVLVCLSFSGAIGWWLVRGGGHFGDGMLKVYIAAMTIGIFGAVECWKMGGRAATSGKGTE